MLYSDVLTSRHPFRVEEHRIWGLQMLEKRFYRIPRERAPIDVLLPIQVDASAISGFVSFLDRVESIDLLADPWPHLLTELMPLVGASGCAILENDPLHRCPQSITQQGTWCGDDIGDLLADLACRSLVGAIEHPTMFVLDDRRRLPRSVRRSVASAVAAPGVFHAQRRTVVLFALDEPRTIAESDMCFIRLLAHCLALRVELRIARDSLMREMDRVSRLQCDVDRLCALVRRQQEL